MARLYDKSGRAKRNKKLIGIGILVASVYFVLIIFAPFKIGSNYFILGIILFAFGLIGFVVALFSVCAAESVVRPIAELMTEVCVTVALVSQKSCSPCAVCHFHACKEGRVSF